MGGAPIRLSGYGRFLWCSMCANNNATGRGVTSGDQPPYGATCMCGQRRRAAAHLFIPFSLPRTRAPAAPAPRRATQKQSAAAPGECGSAAPLRPLATCWMATAKSSVLQPLTNPVSFDRARGGRMHRRIQGKWKGRQARMDTAGNCLSVRRRRSARLDGQEATRAALLRTTNAWRACAPWCAGGQVGGIPQDRYINLQSKHTGGRARPLVHVFMCGAEVKADQDGNESGPWLCWCLMRIERGLGIKRGQ